MAGTQVGICYETLSGQVRFIVIPTDDAALADSSFNVAGCTFAKMSRTNYNNKGVIENLSDFLTIITSSVSTIGIPPP